MEVKTKKSFNDLIKSLTEEILDEEDLDEMTTTASVDGYSTPFAFDPEGEKIKKKFGKKKNSYRKKIGEAAFNRQRKFFSKDLMIKNYLNVYKNK